MEAERGVPVEAKAFAGLSAGARGHSRIRNVNGLVVIVHGGDCVASGVGGEGEGAMVGAGYVRLETWIATAWAGAEGVLDWELTTCFLTGLR